MVQGLVVRDADVVLRAQFRCPHPTIQKEGTSQQLRRALQARRRFVPWANGKHDRVFVPKFTPPSSSSGEEPPAPPPEVHRHAFQRRACYVTTATQDLEGIEPLVLWAPPEGSKGQPITVDPMLTKWLRPHQREGVQFMFECVAGLRQEGRLGCILAGMVVLVGLAWWALTCIHPDDMGLGKTLQGITLLWTLLQHGHELLGAAPLAKRAIIVCPTSLVLLSGFFFNDLCFAPYILSGGQLGQRVPQMASGGCEFCAEKPSA